MDLQIIPYQYTPTAYRIRNAQRTITFPLGIEVADGPNWSYPLLPTMAADGRQTSICIVDAAVVARDLRNGRLQIHPRDPVSGRTFCERMLQFFALPYDHELYEAINEYLEA